MIILPPDRSISSVIRFRNDQENAAVSFYLTLKAMEHSSHWKLFHEFKYCKSTLPGSLELYPQVFMFRTQSIILRA